jgi:hypothetical protein
MNSSPLKVRSFVARNFFPICTEHHLTTTNRTKMTVDGAISHRNGVQFCILWDPPVFYDEIQIIVTDVLNL